MLYLHGVPSNSDEWTAWLALTGGLAVDLPGFGRSYKPGWLQSTIEEYDTLHRALPGLARNRAGEAGDARLGRASGWRSRNAGPSGWNGWC